jgi:hypothetical protein
VEAKKSLSDYRTVSVFDSGLGALQVHGPNGFPCSWQGSAQSASVMPETKITYIPTGNSIQLTITNAGTSKCTIKAGGRISDAWNIGSNANWCDLKATVSGLSN